MAVSARDKHALTLFLVAVDDLDGYVSTFDRAAGDALLRRVSVALGACFRRRSDALCRFDDSGFAVLSGGMDERQASEHGRTLCARVADLRIHHPRSFIPSSAPSVVSIGTSTRCGKRAKRRSSMARQKA